MRVQTIDDKNPRCSRITRNGALNMSEKIFFGPGGPYGRRHDLPGRHLKIRDQRLRAMPNIFKFYTFHQAWPHGTRRVRTFIGLNAGLLVGTHNMYPLFMQVGRPLIQLADGLDICVKLLGVLDAVVIEPIPRLMRF